MLNILCEINIMFKALSKCYSILCKWNPFKRTLNNKTLLIPLETSRNVTLCDVSVQTDNQDICALQREVYELSQQLAILKNRKKSILIRQLENEVRYLTEVNISLCQQEKTLQTLYEWE
jgi:hypothetical protein